eukprot:1803687-Pyramimonas_sp.AAC.1
MWRRASQGRALSTHAAVAFPSRNRARALRRRPIAIGQAIPGPRGSRALRHLPLPPDKSLCQDDASHTSIGADHEPEEPRPTYSRP